MMTLIAKIAKFSTRN